MIDFRRDIESKNKKHQEWEEEMISEIQSLNDEIEK